MKAAADHGRRWNCVTGEACSRNVDVVDRCEIDRCAFDGIGCDAEP